MQWPSPRYVVGSRSGPGTAETIYTDNRGDEWIAGPGRGRPSSKSTTGEEYGQLRSDGSIKVMRT